MRCLREDRYQHPLNSGRTPRLSPKAFSCLPCPLFRRRTTPRAIPCAPSRTFQASAPHPPTPDELDDMDFIEDDPFAAPEPAEDVELGEAGRNWVRPPVEDFDPQTTPLGEPACT